MKRGLGILATVAMLSMMALSVVGCSSYNTASPCCEPVCQVCEQKPCCPAPCDPCTPCDPCCAPVKKACRTTNNTNSITRDGVTVTARQPQMCMLGDTFVLELEVKACIDVCEVKVGTMLPEGVTLVKSDPEGVVSQRTNGIHWMFDRMHKGECRVARATLRADREGDICACFCVVATPVQFCQMVCARPVLCCECCGPEEVCPGDAINYCLTVTNKGSCAAEDVVVVNQVPDGFEHCSKKKCLTFNLGCIEPCQTKKINICYTGCKRGKQNNIFNVTSCNAVPCNSDCCTCICCCGVELYKTGPKEIRIGKDAHYLITVVNTGDKCLTNVCVTDCAPNFTSILEAKGATVNGNQAVWKIRELKPGEKQTMNLALTTCTPGYYCNKACVSTCQGCCANAEACTRWRGSPSINACISETEEPVCVGEPLCYKLRLCNQGTESDSNVLVVITFPKEVAPVATCGDLQGVVQGQTVTFGPIVNFSARQGMELRVDARAKEPGDARIKVEVTSDTLRTPLVQTASTIVH